MEASISQFIEELKTPVKSMSVTKLREREEIWRALWSWLGDDVKYFVLRIGSQVRAVRRDYKGSTGELGEVKFVPSEFEIATYEKRYNETDGKYYYETKVVKIPAAAIMFFEFISEQESADDVDKYEIQNLEEEGLTVGEKVA